MRFCQCRHSDAPVLAGVRGEAGSAQFRGHSAAERSPKISLAHLNSFSRIVQQFFRCRSCAFLASWANGTTPEPKIPSASTD